MRKVEENGRPIGFIVLVERESPLVNRDIESPGKVEEAPGVPGGDDVSLFRLATQASGRIPVIADGCHSQNYQWSHRHNYFTDSVGTTTPNASDTGWVALGRLTP